MKISVKNGNVLEQVGDVLILKYAQGLFGVDEIVVNTLSTIQSDIKKSLPPPKHFFLADGKPLENINKVLFMGVVTLSEFKYVEIREFVKLSLHKIKEITPMPKKIIFTLHGSGYGLNIEEAFIAELNGISDALSEGLIEYDDIEEIIFVEKVDKIYSILDQVLVNFKQKSNPFLTPYNYFNSLTLSLISSAYEEDKKYTFDKANFGLVHLINLLKENKIDIKISGMVSDIYKSLLSVENQISKIDSMNLTNVDFMLNIINPVYIETQILANLLIHAGFKELGWVCQLHAINYLNNLCQKFDFSNPYFITKKKEVLYKVKIEFLNHFGKRLISKNNFPWDKVNEFLIADDIESYWKQFNEL